MGPDSNSGPVVAYLDGQPVEIGHPLPEITPDYSAGAITNISVKRAVYETTMREFYRRIEAERKDRIERTGDPSYTEFEALLPWLVSFLLPEKKCRAVMEYDPAADRIKFFQEDDPAGQ